FGDIIDADEVLLLFERATFLVISHCQQKQHRDPHRFEKISNIIKQFKLSCSKVAPRSRAACTCRTGRSAPSSTSSPPTPTSWWLSPTRTLCPALTMLNIRNARKHFERLERPGGPAVRTGPPLSKWRTDSPKTAPPLALAATSSTRQPRSSTTPTTGKRKRRKRKRRETIAERRRGSANERGCPPAPAGQRRQRSFRIVEPRQRAPLSKQEVWPDCPATTSRVLRLLLSKYRLDKDLLLERFYEREPEDFLARHNIPASQWGADRPLRSRRVRLPRTYRRRQWHTGYRNGWQRLRPRVLVDCYRSYVAQRMLQAGQFEGLQCAAFDCRALLDDQLVLRLLEGSPKLRRASSRRRCRHQLCHLQPPAGLTAPTGPTASALCACLTTPCAPAESLCRFVGKTFCFACAQDWHEPISCSMLRRWQQKNAGESMSTQWFMANTKECPKCHATIEKNGRLQSHEMPQCTCNHEFCWVCMDDWQPHGKEWYNCNRETLLRRGASGARPPQQALSRNYLSRYLHYYDLYMNHLKSLEFEGRLQETVHSKMDEMHWIEVKFLRDAVAVLCNCRRVLMYTYVFAYYLKPSNQQKIFEDNQRNLQLATEDLSEVLEREMQLEDVAQLKRLVQDKFAVLRDPLRRPTGSRWYEV
uniref:RBR-type E3 ubiquitin transferase n=1 Tax=Macrostomum lignano TaxID=282301 RepID=A0A1I8JQ06_9PLAT